MILWIGVPPLLLLLFGLMSPVTGVDTAFFLSARGQVESVKVGERGPLERQRARRLWPL